MKPISTLVAPAYNILDGVRVLDLDDVEYAPFNPPNRLQKEVIKIFESLKEHGQLETIHVVYQPKTGKYVTAEGNRRVCALRMAGAETVKAHVYVAKDPSEATALLHFLFDHLNDTRLALQGSAQLQAALLGGPVPNSVIGSAKKFVQNNFTKGEIKTLVNDGTINPTVVSSAKKIAKHILGKGADKTSNEFLGLTKTTINWLIENETQQQAQIYVRRGYSGSAMLKAIESNKPSLPQMGKTRKQIRDEKKRDAERKTAARKKAVTE
jgi:hypothetical protein